MNLLAVNFIVIIGMMSAVWLASLVARDASIVDIVWGLGFVVVAWSSWLVSGSTGTTDLIVRIGITVWGLRLAGYLAWRNLHWERHDPHQHSLQVEDRDEAD